MRILFIPDGNRRAARKLGLSYEEAYSLAAAKTDMVVKHLLRREEVDALVFYGLSYDNITKRSLEEMEPIYLVQENQYVKWVEDPFFSMYGVRVRFAGEFKQLRRSSVLPGSLPESYMKAAKQLEEATETNSRKQLYGLIGYSSKIELKRAFERMENQPGVEELDGPKVNPIDILPFLDLPISIDLVIRTGQEQRISDCLLYQTAYAEFIFLEKYFPEIDERDLETCLLEFKKRERRYGR